MVVTHRLQMRKKNERIDAAEMKQQKSNRKNKAGPGQK